MTRIGKIARLPHNVREELNCRLQDGEEGTSLLAWLNSRPAVQEVLSAKFDGRPVSEQNLSAWRQGGYEDWLAHQEIVVQVEQLATNAAELKGMAKNTQLTEHLVTLVAVRYAEVLANPHQEPEEQWERKVKSLRSLCRDVIAMRKSEQKGERLGMERERWSFECHDLEEKRVAKERAKARAAELAPFDAQVQQSILAKVHGEEGAARVAEIMHDLPRGTVWYAQEGEDGGSRMEDGEGEETLNVERRTSNIEGESRPIKADQGLSRLPKHGECEDGGSRMENGQVVDGEGDDGGQSEDEECDAIEEDGGIDIQETALRLAASQICQMLGGFKMEKDFLGSDPKNYAAVINCLAKLSKSALDIEMFRENVAENERQLEDEPGEEEPGGISPETLAKIEEELKLM